MVTISHFLLFYTILWVLKAPYFHFCGRGCGMKMRERERESRQVQKIQLDCLGYG